LDLIRKSAAVWKISVPEKQTGLSYTPDNATKTVVSGEKIRIAVFPDQLKSNVAQNFWQPFYLPQEFASFWAKPEMWYGVILSGATAQVRLRVLHPVSIPAKLP
jgi:hypothetical protein